MYTKFFKTTFFPGSLPIIVEKLCKDKSVNNSHAKNCGMSAKYSTKCCEIKIFGEILQERRANIGKTLKYFFTLWFVKKLTYYGSSLMTFCWELQGCAHQLIFSSLISSI